MMMMTTMIIHDEHQKKNGTYEFLSGVPITERTQFLRLNDPKDYERFQVGIFIAFKLCIVFYYMNISMAQ